MSGLPHLPSEIRTRQLWLVLWYEPNTKLTNAYYEMGGIDLLRKYPDNFFRSLNGVFNGTLSYRKDSFIPHRVYTHWSYRASRDIQIDEQTWSKYQKTASAKRK